MTQLSDITADQSSGLNYIDALLDTGPGWNFLTPATNTLTYTFSIASGNESGVNDQQAFSDAQQNQTLNAMNYVSSVTGINFSESTNPDDADIHFAMIDISGPSTAGLTSYHYGYQYDGNETITSYHVTAYIYLDNVEWLSNNTDLTPGGQGYETLLHEFGHALGLKHPFEGSPLLPTDEDNTSNTLMSYTSSGGPYDTFRSYDIAALNWIYGGDGLGGALGVGSTSGGRFWTGTSSSDTLNAGSGNDQLVGGDGNDRLSGGGGNDNLDGGSGIDTAAYSGAHSQYTISPNSGGFSVSGGSDGSDTLTNVERLQFSDTSVALDISGNAGLTAKILGAVFGASSVSNKTYAGIGLSLLDSGTSYQDLMQLALNARLGNGFSNTDEVNLLYQNLVGTAPSSSDLDFWTNAITAGQYSQASLGVLAADLDLNTNNINLVGLASTGLEFV